MSYQLRHGEKLGTALQRICREQIGAAIDIVIGEKGTDNTRVHATRKHIKKARAALRLVRKEIGGGLFRKQDHALRDVARLTSEIRDAEVRLQTVQKFEGSNQRRRRSSYPKLESMLTMELENFVAAFAEWQIQAVPILERAHTAVGDWPLDDFDCKQLRRAVQRSYKKARKALARAQCSSTPEDFHEFRSDAKRLWYDLRILRPINPLVLKNLSDDLDSLGGLLGRAHDLSFLSDRLRRDDRSSDWASEGHKLLAVIEVNQTDLQRGAAELGEHFFAERPRDFGDRIATWLKEWEQKGSPRTAEKISA